MSLRERMARRRLPLGLCASVLAVDWVSKAVAVNLLSVGDSVRILGDYVRLSLSFNPGAAFGLSFGGVNVHLVITAAVIGLIAAMALFTSADSKREQAGYGLILGGAIGNLGDRLLTGKVTDFLDIGIGDLRWWTFNVADIALTVGVALLLMVSFRSRLTVE